MEERQVNLLSQPDSVSFILSCWELSQGMAACKSPSQSAFLGNLNHDWIQTIPMLQVSHFFRALTSSVILIWTWQESSIVTHYIIANILPLYRLRHYMEFVVILSFQIYKLTSGPFFPDLSFCSIHSRAFPILVWVHDQFPSHINNPSLPPQKLVSQFLSFNTRPNPQFFQNAFLSHRGTKAMPEPVVCCSKLCVDLQ